ncbi:hypothetical protein LTR36_000850, partial [Oleoguttula mirabilis]
VIAARRNGCRRSSACRSCTTCAPRRPRPMALARPSMGGMGARSSSLLATFF